MATTSGETAWTEKSGSEESTEKKKVRWLAVRSQVQKGGGRGGKGVEVPLSTREKEGKKEEGEK